MISFVGVFRSYLNQHILPNLDIFRLLFLLFSSFFWSFCQCCKFPFYEIIISHFSFIQFSLGFCPFVSFFFFFLLSININLLDILQCLRLSLAPLAILKQVGLRIMSCLGVYIKSYSDLQTLSPHTCKFAFGRRQLVGLLFFVVIYKFNVWRILFNRCSIGLEFSLVFLFHFLTFFSYYFSWVEDICPLLSATLSYLITSLLCLASSRKSVNTSNFLLRTYGRVKKIKEHYIKREN